MFQTVDRQLCRMTNNRMFDLGIACDMICVTRPPIHVTPLLVLRNVPYSHTLKTGCVLHPVDIGFLGTKFRLEAPAGYEGNRVCVAGCHTASRSGHIVF